MPPPSDYDNVVIPFDKEAPNFVRFTTRVDGKQIDMKVDQRAIAVGVDRTDILLGLNLPLANFLADTRKALGRLPAEALQHTKQPHLRP